MRPRTVREVALVQQERDRALRLQAEEYERRLDVLNHAHEKAQERDAEFIGREAFDDYVSANNSQREAMVAAVAQRFASLNRTLFAVGGLFLTIIVTTTTLVVSTR